MAFDFTNAATTKTRKPAQAKTGVIWRGASLIDGKPIMVIATLSDRNPKTGKMVQTYIMREDIDPRDASKNGEDFSICGNCPMRGEVTTDKARKIAKGRRCYVKVYQGPLNVFRAYHRGVYPASDAASERAELGRGRMVRIGTYGDPAAVPVSVWADLTRESAGWTGYTHQWRDPKHADIAAFCMASTETREDAVDAIAQGWRTFRVTPDVSPVAGSEISCPASKEMGARVQCAACGLCKGNSSRGKSIAIREH